MEQPKGIESISEVHKELCVGCSTLDGSMVAFGMCADGEIIVFMDSNAATMLYITIADLEFVLAKLKEWGGA